MLLRVKASKKIANLQNEKTRILKSLDMWRGRPSVRSDGDEKPGDVLGRGQGPQAGDVPESTPWAGGEDNTAADKGGGLL